MANWRAGAVETRWRYARVQPDDVLVARRPESVRYDAACLVSAGQCARGQVLRCCHHFVISRRWQRDRTARPPNS